MIANHTIKLKVLMPIIVTSTPSLLLRSNMILSGFTVSLSHFSFAVKDRKLEIGRQRNVHRRFAKLLSLHTNYLRQTLEGDAYFGGHTYLRGILLGGECAVIELLIATVLRRLSRICLNRMGSK